jgi:hypothetical protein
VITVLVVGTDLGPLAAAASGHPSVEILTAGASEDALEKLARNRRIDAVLLLAGEAGGAIAAAIREEDPGAPPLFAPASGGAIPAVRLLEADSPGQILEALVHALSGDR